MRDQISADVFVCGIGDDAANDFLRKTFYECSLKTYDKNVHVLLQRTLLTHDDDDDDDNDEYSRSFLDKNNTNKFVISIHETRTDSHRPYFEIILSILCLPGSNEKELS